VLDSTNIVPRLAVSYDVLGDSKLLVMGTAGRYYAQVEMAWAATFNQIPQGRTQYEQYYWNPETSDYDLFFRAVTGSTYEITEVDPYYKDEVSLGMEWQFHPDWAFKVRGSRWEAKDFPQIYDQIDAAGALYPAIENTPGAKSERTAVDLVIQRRFKNNWMMAASYTLSKTEGNCQYLDNGQCIADYGELIAFTNDEGVPWSHVNRYGSLPQDRPNVFKVRGAYNWQLGRGHSILFGGLAYYHDGPVWTPYTSLTDPISGGSVLAFEEERGSRRLGGRKQLDFNVQWSFPIAGQFDGFLRTEILNLTNEQEQIGIAGMAESCFWADGDCTSEPTPLPTGQNFQYPRTIRIQVGFNF
jgi:hypothetical protein